MNVVLMLTRRCNAACAHCSSSCGPDRREHLSRDELVSVMRQAAALSVDAPRFALTGGEPFLDFELLLDIAQEARSLGGVATCVTNGYWAASPEQARDKLARLKQAGLETLAVSTSPFHQRFVKRERVERALAAAREVGVHCTLKYIRARSDPEPPEQVRRWALGAGAQDVQDIGLIPYLRDGVTLPDSEFALAPGLPEGPCPAAAFTVREDGAVLRCCSPGAEGEGFVLGDVGTTTLAALKARFDYDGRLRLLRAQGPAHIARQAIAAGLAHRLRPSYTDVCDLCAHLGSDPELNGVAQRAAEDYEMRHLQRLLTTLVGH